MIKTIILDEKQVEKHLLNLKQNADFFYETDRFEDADFYLKEIKRIRKFLRETKVKTQ